MTSVLSQIVPRLVVMGASCVPRHRGACSLSLWHVGVLPRVCAVCEGMCRKECQALSIGGLGGRGARNRLFLYEGARRALLVRAGLGHATTGDASLMPAGDTDSDAASNAAATKVQAILRGSAARKTVTKSAASARKKVCWSTGWWPQGWNGIGGEGWRRRGWSQWHVGGEEGCGDGGGCVGGGGDGGLS